MTKNFGQLQDAIKHGSGGIAETRLLSISFDPEHDTPEVLGSYAVAEQADPAIWSFATGAAPVIEEVTKRFAVFVRPEAGNISHRLSTALIDREGRIVETWRGNSWKPVEVVAAIERL